MGLASGEVLVVPGPMTTEQREAACGAEPGAD